MRPLILLAALAALALATPVASLRSAEITQGKLAAKDEKGKPNNVPGSFHPYNVNARQLTPEELIELEKEGKDRDKYTSKGKFHCLVTEYDLDPVVMLFAR